jgi:hypothetical protein
MTNKRLKIDAMAQAKFSVIYPAFHSMVDLSSSLFGDVYQAGYPAGKKNRSGNPMKRFFTAGDSWSSIFGG